MLVDGDHPIAGRAPAETEIADIGDFRIAHGDIQGSLAAIEAQARPIDHLVALGGDHTITLALLRALAARTGPLALVHFDAHVDTWPESFGQRFGHGSPFFHAIEEGLIDPRRTVQVGIRSPMDRSVHDWTVGKGVTILFAEAVHERGPQADRRADPRGGRRRAGLSELRHRRARSGLRAGHRHARDRRPVHLAGAGDPAPSRRPAVSGDGRRRGVAALRRLRDHGARRGHLRLGIPVAARAAGRDRLRSRMPEDGIANVQEDSDRQSRRDRLPDYQNGAADGDRDGRGLFGGRCRGAARARGRRGGIDRPAAVGRKLSAHRPDRRGLPADRRRGRASRLWVSVGAAGFRDGARRGRHRVYRPRPRRRSRRWATRSRRSGWRTRPA